MTKLLLSPSLLFRLQYAYSITASADDQRIKKSSEKDCVIFFQYFISSSALFSYPLQLQLKTVQRFAVIGFIPSYHSSGWKEGRVLREGINMSHIYSTIKSVISEHEIHYQRGKMLGA